MLLRGARCAFTIVNDCSCDTATCEPLEPHLLHSHVQSRVVSFHLPCALLLPRERERERERDVTTIQLVWWNLIP